MRFADASLLHREWALVAPIFERRRRLGGRPADDRLALEAMLYVAWSRISWGSLPERFGKPNSVARTFDRWCEDGTIDQLLTMPPSKLTYDNETDGVELVVRHRLLKLNELRRRHRRSKRLQPR